MNKAAFALPFAVGAFLLFAACGDDVTETGISQLAAGEEFPKCTEENSSEMLYAADSGKAYICTGKAWTPLHGESTADTVVVRDTLILSNVDTLVICDSLFGLNGTSCTAEMLEDSSGYKIVCGTDSVDVVLDGIDGGNCSFAEGDSGKIILTCNSKSVKFYKAYCANYPYDPDKSFCFDDSIVSLCGGNLYDLKTSFCYRKGKKDSIISLCGGKSYDLEAEVCINSEIFSLCGDVPYDLKTSFCYRKGEKDTVVSLCGGNIYDLDTAFCFNNALYVCGHKPYSPSESFCYEDSVVSLCGDVPYDLKTSFCYRKGEKDTVVSLCGGNIYDLDTAFCFNNALYVCGHKPYSPSESFCYEDSVVSLCGGALYDLKTSFCYRKGTKDSIVSLCGGKSYDLDTAFCYEHDGFVHLYSCGHKPFSPSESFCFKDSIVSYCHESVYHLDSAFCFNDSIISLCGGKSYDLNESFCFEDSVVRYCGNSETFNPDAILCDSRDYHKYRIQTIGNQTWMNEDLAVRPKGYIEGTYSSERIDYADYGDKIYYTWATAMDTLGSYSEQGKGCGNAKKCSPAGKIRGICPEGWHLPDTAEWRELYNYAETYGEGFGVGECLRAVTFGGGRDCFGFHATPAGYYDSWYDPEDDDNVVVYGSSIVYYWTSTEYNDNYNNAYVWYLKSNSEIGYIHKHKSIELHTIRCLKD